MASVGSRGCLGDALAKDNVARTPSAFPNCSQQGARPVILCSGSMLLGGFPVSEATRILSAIDQGDPHAAEQLLPLVYQELRL